LGAWIPAAMALALAAMGVLLVAMRKLRERFAP
jgi:hypothetical protein